MSPVIRIDDEVWAWLKSLARPFEDTPNSVLRSIAGIDRGQMESRGAPIEAPDEEAPVQSPTLHVLRGRRITGDQLNRQFGLGARHALYHKDGTFYERLTAFPGVLCDARGYVSFETRDQFESDPRLEIGQKVNVPRSLSSHPRYKLFPAAKPDLGAVSVT